MLMGVVVPGGLIALTGCAPTRSLPPAPAQPAPVTTVAPVNEDGVRLAGFLNRLQVERGWTAGQHVNWETGAALGRPLPGWSTNTATHCSGYASAVAARLGVPFPHPPFPADASLFADTYGKAFGRLATRTDALLANKQGEWLAIHARAVVPEAPCTTPSAGNWVHINAYQAQSYANQGYLAVAVRINPDPKKPGHIAIIAPAQPGAKLGDRPTRQTAYTSLAVDGPFEAQSGAFNSSYTTVSRGFSPAKGPSSEWFGADSDRNQVKFYVYYMPIQGEAATLAVKG
jgi:hypothetical protein